MRNTIRQLTGLAITIFVTSGTGYGLSSSA